MAVRPLKVAVLGATGAVGKALVQALEESDLPVDELRLLATERSAGAELDFRGDLYRVQPVRDGAFDGQHPGVNQRLIGPHEPIVGRDRRVCPISPTEDRRLRLRQLRKFDRPRQGATSPSR